MLALEQAIEDVSKAISARAKSVEKPEELEQLAKALAVMKFGQQGVTDYRYAGRYEQTYSTDQHETHHEGGKRTQPAGFSKDERGTE